MPSDAETWFGKQPPDLSLIARSRVLIPIYRSYMAFMPTKTRIWCVNNLYLPERCDAACLEDRQGLQKPVFQNEARRSRQRQNGSGGRGCNDAGRDEARSMISSFGTPSISIMPASQSRRSANRWAFS